MGQLSGFCLCEGGLCVTQCGEAASSYSWWESVVRLGSKSEFFKKKLTGKMSLMPEV